MLLRLKVLCLVSLLQFACGGDIVAISVQQKELSTSLRYDDLSDVAEFVADGRSWDHPNITYFFANNTPDIASDRTFSAVRDAMALWSSVVPLSFSEVSSAASADIVIRWGAGNHGDDTPFDGTGKILAHAFYPPPNGGSLAGDVHFDEDETWTDSVRASGEQPIDLVTVAAHELGHALGLGHSLETNALMYPYYGRSHRNLSEDDIQGIQSIYGRPGRSFISGSGKCLDAHAPDWNTNGGRVQIWDCNGLAHQQWRIEGGKLILASGKCLDVHWPDRTTNGGRVQLWDCHGGENQQWRLSGGMLVSGSGKCLDVHGPDAGTNGGRVQIWDCLGGMNQQWRF